MSDITQFANSEDKAGRAAGNPVPVLTGAYWNELRIFLAVAKERSFSRAAQALNISQPSVGRHMKRLQDCMGVPLIVSSSTGATLTAQGERLARRLSDFDLSLWQLSQELSSDGKDIAGTVRVATTDGLAAFFIAPNLHYLSAQYPNVRVSLQLPGRGDDLRQSTADITVGFIQAPSPDFDLRALGTLHLLPVATKRYIHQHGMPTVNTLEDHVFVQSPMFSSKSSIWDPWLDLIERGKVSHMAETSFTYGMMVKADLGIGLLGNYTVLEPLAVPIDLGVQISVPMHMAVLSDRLESRPVRAVCDFLEQVLGPENIWFKDELHLNPDHTPYDEGFRALFNID